jgi:hypothetical protein
MKKIFLLVVAIATAFTQQLFAQDEKAYSLSTLLSYYYDIKNALVNSDAAATALKAGDFLKATCFLKNAMSVYAYAIHHILAIST